MTTLTADRHLTAAAPAVSVSTVGLMFISGFFATIAFDLWGQVISPGLGFANLSPHGLAQSLLASLGLPSNAFAGYFVHFYLVGLVGYPIGWMYVFAPIWQRVVGDTHWLSASRDLRCWSVGLCHRRYHGNRRFAVLPELYRHHLGRPGWPRALCRRDGRCS
jgi:hypothetical protein